MHRTDIKIAIAGTAADTVNYVKYVASAQAVPVVTLEREIIAGCDGLLLPGAAISRLLSMGNRTTAPTTSIRNWTSYSCRPLTWLSAEGCRSWASARGCRS